MPQLDIGWAKCVTNAAASLASQMSGSLYLVLELLGTGAVDVGRMRTLSHHRIFLGRYFFLC